MSDIDEVIRRSRQVGSITDRRTFTIAKDRAVKKMRLFTLESADHFALELIQGAVAKGAKYIDFTHRQSTTRIAWVGGGFEEEELLGLFDYLFEGEGKASEAIKQIAAGINGMLFFSPKRIVIESGNGSRSTRIEIDPQTLEMVVGTPENITAINGTFISASDISQYGSVIPLVETRCITLTIPIIINDHPLFGYSSQRSPDLMGYSKTIKFDDGLLYGTIGITKATTSKDSDRETPHTFKILTHGVWIQSETRKLGNYKENFSGVIGYDVLNKTIDRASIVQDETWDAMWASVEMYASDLLADRPPTQIEVLDINLNALDLKATFKLAQNRGGVLIFPDRSSGRLIRPDPTLFAEYEKILGYPSLYLDFKDLAHVRAMLEQVSEVHVLKGTQEELEFLKKPKVDLPRGAFFVAPLEVKSGRHTLTIFTPRNIFESRVEIVNKGRLVQKNEHDLPPGFVIQSTGGWGYYFHKHLDELSIRIADDYVSQIRPKTLLALHALRAISLTSIFSISGGSFSIRRLGYENDAILDAPILLNLNGNSLSIKDVVQHMHTQYGLAYGCICREDSALHGLDFDRILDLNKNEEEFLIAIFSHTSYVRIDERDILAKEIDTNGDEFTIRDIAVGLGLDDRPFILFDEKKEASDLVLNKILSTLQQNTRSQDHELARQSLRHLIWMVTHPNTPDSISQRLMDLRYFRSPNEKLLSEEVLEGEVEMKDGWPQSVLTIGCTKKVGRKIPSLLVMNSFVFYTLSRIRKVVSEGQYAHRADLREGLIMIEIEKVFPKKYKVVGTLSLMPRTSHKTFTIIDSSGPNVSVFGSLPTSYMCAGEVKTEGKHPKEDYVDLFIDATFRLYEKVALLLEKSSEFDKFHDYVEPALFGILDLIKVVKNRAFIEIDANFEGGRKLLRLNLFPTKDGVPISALALLGRYQNPKDQLSIDTPTYLLEWLDRVFSLAITPEQSSRSWRAQFDNDDVTKKWITSLVTELSDRSIVYSDRSLEPQDPVIEFDQHNIFIYTKHVFFEPQESERKGLWMALELLSAFYKNNIISRELLRSEQSVIMDGK